MTEIDANDERDVRERFAAEAAKLRTAYNAALWAMEKHLHGVNRNVSDQIRALRHEIEREFGAPARAASLFAGPVLLWTARREEQRLKRGQTYEPPTFRQCSNWAAAEV